jgi:hypothetical protein
MRLPFVRVKKLRIAKNNSSDMIPNRVPMPDFDQFFARGFFFPLFWLVCKR